MNLITRSGRDEAALWEVSPPAVVAEARGAAPALGAPCRLPSTDAKRQESTRPCGFANDWTIGCGRDHASERHSRHSLRTGRSCTQGALQPLIPTLPLANTPEASPSTASRVSTTVSFYPTLVRRGVAEQDTVPLARRCCLFC